VYLHNTDVAVDTQKIMVCDDQVRRSNHTDLGQSMGVKCVGVSGSQEKRFDCGCVQDALKSIFAEVA